MPGAAQEFQGMTQEPEAPTGLPTTSDEDEDEDEDEDFGIPRQSALGVTSLAGTR